MLAARFANSTTPDTTWPGSKRGELVWRAALGIKALAWEQDCGQTLKPLATTSLPFGRPSESTWKEGPMPIRIYEIAKKLGVDSRVVLAKAKELGIAAARIPPSSLDTV